MNKSSQWLLLAGAFFALSVAAKSASLGAPPAKYMSASQLADNGSKPGRVKITGQVVDVQWRPFGTNVKVRDSSYQEITVSVSTEAKQGPIRLGSFYSFEGEIISGNAVSVSMPGCIRKLKGEVDSRTQRVVVKNEIAYYDHTFGVSRILAPGVPDGTWDVNIVSVEGGRTIAMISDKD